MTMIGPDNPLEALTVANVPPLPGAHAFRLESLDSTLLASVLEVSLDGFLLFNRELRCLFANRAACEMLGRSLEAITGQPLYAFFVEANPEEHFLRQTGRWSAVIERANGERCEVECTRAAIEQGGHVQSVLIMRDVTNVRLALREAKILKRLASGMTYTRSLEVILENLARDVVQLLDIQACFITLVSGSPPQFRAHSDYGLPRGFTDTMCDLAQVGARLPTLYAFQEKRIVLHNFPPNDAFYTRLFPQQRWSPEIEALLRQFLELRLQFPGGNIVSVPLLYNDTTLGVFNAYYAFNSPPDMADLSLFTSIAEFTAVTVHNAREFMAAQDQAALEERRRLARELHDSVSQQLYGVALGVQSARRFLESDVAYASESLDYALELVRTCQEEMRSLLLVLHSETLESSGLVTVLQRHVVALRSRHNLAIEVVCCSEPALPLDAKEALYRIAQEALYNVVKHAQARCVKLRLQEGEGVVVLEVEDDGVGFNPAAAFPGHLGLLSMRERAYRLHGTLEIKSGPRWGTSVRAVLPMLSVKQPLLPSPPKE